MLSAYSHGNLKKNPLLGTSLAVDPNRQAMRQGFNDLYSEAKSRGTGEGRSGMLSELASQYASLGQYHSPRLAQIPNEYADIATEASSYSSPKEIERLSKRSTTAQKYLDDLSKITKGKKKIKLIPAYKSEIDAAYKEAGRPGDKNRFTRDYLSNMASEFKTYTSAASAKSQKLHDERYIPLAEEETQRRRSLQDRADLFNAFLGID